MNPPSGYGLAAAVVCALLCLLFFANDEQKIADLAGTNDALRMDNAELRIYINTLEAADRRLKSADEAEDMEAKKLMKVVAAVQARLTACADAEQRKP